MKRFAAALLAFSPALFAQSNTGGITGTVFDQSQVVMSGVKIMASNLGPNVTQTATTNTDGVYSVPALEPGAYRLTLEKAGLFSSAVPDLSPKSAQLATNGGIHGGQVQMDANPLALPTGGFILPPDGKFTDITNVNAIYYLNPHVTMPYVQQWNLGFGFQWGNMMD